MAPSDQRQCSRNSWVEQWSHSFTIAAQAASPSRATRSTNPAIASAQSASTGRPHSASASVNGRHAGVACTSPSRHRRPPRWTYACGLLIVNGVSLSPNRSQ